jgi:hypothetical protein
MRDEVWVVEKRMPEGAMKEARAETLPRRKGAEGAKEIVVGEADAQRA